MWEVAAALGGASLFSSILGTSASKSAARSQAAAAREAATTQYKMWEEQKELARPWTKAGERALGRYEEMLLGGPAYFTAEYHQERAEREKISAGKTLKEGPKRETIRTRLKKPIPPKMGLTELQSMQLEGTPATMSPEYKAALKKYQQDLALWERQEREGVPLGGLREAVAKGEVEPTPTLREGRSALSPSGVPGGSPEEILGAFRVSPGYQFRLGEGMRAIERSAAARGQQLSGATLKDLAQYGQQMASTEFDKFMTRYYARTAPFAQMAGYGPSMAGPLMAAGAQTSAGVASAQLAAGQARAGQAISQANLQTGLLQNLGTLGMMYGTGMFGGGQQPSISTATI